MEITSGMVKDLRERTGLGIMECKMALGETKGDMEEAIVYLRKRGLKIAEKKSGRTTSEGVIGAYIHAGGKIGVMVEVNCESDFVAKNTDFASLVKDIAMHIAASDPRFIAKEDVTEQVLAREREIIAEQLKSSGKPPDMIPKIVEGKLQSYYSEVCLLEQPFVKDQALKVRDVLAAFIAKSGENVTIRRFTRYRMGEDV
ncbi:MAG: elongation factor Ts [Acidobacteria bacterium]|nr:elongation factor Ts [Acidobacteriota bacterium]